MESALLAWFTAITGSMFFLVVPVLLVFGLVGLAAWGRPKAAALPALLLVLGIVSYPAAFLFKENVHAWLASTGAQGVVVFSRLEPTGNRINQEPEMRWVGTLKLADGTLRDVRLATHAVRTCPDVDGFMTVASTPYPVRYRPAYPDLFVLEVRDDGRASCDEGRRKVQDLLAKLMVAQGAAAATTANELAALQATLRHCPP